MVYLGGGDEGSFSSGMSLPLIIMGVMVASDDTAVALTSDCGRMLTWLRIDMRSIAEEALGEAPVVGPSGDDEAEDIRFEKC